MHINDLWLKVLQLNIFRTQWLLQVRKVNNKIDWFSAYEGYYIRHEIGNISTIIYITIKVSSNFKYIFLLLLLKGARLYAREIAQEDSLFLAFMRS